MRFYFKKVSCAGGMNDKIINKGMNGGLRMKCKGDVCEIVVHLSIIAALSMRLAAYANKTI